MKKFTLGAIALIALAFVVAIPRGMASAATDVACIQNAVSVRESSIMNAVTTAQSVHTQALNTRASALQSAWGITDKTARKEAVKSAWSTYKTTMETNHQTRKSAHQTIKETFKQSKQACH